MKNYVAKLHAYLLALGDDSIAAKQSKYMRFRFPFMGIMNTQRAQYWKEYQAIEGVVSDRDMLPFIDACMSYPEREMWYIALDVIKKYKNKLKADDLSIIETFIIKADWWDIVDIAASHAVGSIYKNSPESRGEINDWIHHDNFWLRRTAIIYQLGYRLKTDENLLYHHILLCSHEKEFFIRKAIGWALREYSKHRPESVRNFIEIHRDKLSPFSIREGAKYL